MTFVAGIIDSGISGPAASHVVAAMRFDAGVTGVSCNPVVPDALHHGTVMAEIIMSLAPHCRFLNAQIFDQSRTTSPGALAEALRWATREGARLINLSVGLAADRLELRQACRAARDQGVILLAASPARGGPVFPAAYDGVFRISGDARCAPGEISALQNGQADFGAYPRGPGMQEGIAGGASFSVAWVTGLVAGYLQDSPSAGYDQIRRHLVGISRYHGAERRLV